MKLLNLSSTSVRVGRYGLHDAQQKTIMLMASHLSRTLDFGDPTVACNAVVLSGKRLGVKIALWQTVNSCSES